jgi:hypothetical protein
MGGARLERALDRVLQIDRRAGAGPVEDLPLERRGAETLRRAPLDALDQFKFN